MSSIVLKIAGDYKNDPTRLMDILLDIQHELAYIPEEEVALLAEQLNISSVDIIQTISFYHFFTTKPTMFQLRTATI